MSYLISYKLRRGGDLELVEMPSTFKLILWIARHAAHCVAIVIQRVED